MRRPQDVEAAVELGVSWIGFVLAPSRRQVSWTELADLTRRIPSPGTGGVQEGRAQRPPGSSGTQWVAVTVDAAVDDYRRLLDLGCPWIQLHGSEPPEVCRAIAGNLIKAVRAGDEVRYREVVNYILYDGAEAGSGQAWDWPNLKPPAGQPFILAGGLHPDNVAEAVRALKPHGVDVASGIEDSPGVKSLEKMRRFMRNVCV